MFGRCGDGMILDIEFTNQTETFDMVMKENSQQFNLSFGEVYEVNSPSGDNPSGDGNFITENDVVEMLNNFKAAKIGWVTLLADAWVGEDNLYRQVVKIEGVTENSQVDLTPNVEQLSIFYEKDITFVTENDGGTVTVYVIGQKPTNDYTIQVTITEVEI